ncbi:MAG: cytochrome ubiquinol oxidase subunit I [Burkholderiaceae bacterium]|nr:cytochrome ubiquinol oxidase subunit I [Burkholderiaceae bacterium]
MDISLLAWTRVQFLLSLAFFFFFLALTLGLAWLLLLFKWRARRSGHSGWLAAYRFWVRIFALSFVLTLAGSAAMLFQLGGLWAGLMDRIGNIAGPLLGYAVLTLFVFKSCFLGVMLFGQRRVSERVHTLSVGMVAVGLTAAVFWLAVLLAWLDTPLGARLFEGRYQVFDWQAVLSNPSLGWRMGALLAGAALAAACLTMGVTGVLALRRKLEEGERLAFHAAVMTALVAGAIQVPLAIGGLDVMRQYQPAKAAALMGYWHTGQPADLVLLAWPDARTESNLGAISIPGAGANWLGADAQGQLQGLDSFSGMGPPVAVAFWLWRIEILSWLVIMMVSCWAAMAGRKHRFDAGNLPRPLLRLLAGGLSLGALVAVMRAWGDVLGRAPYVVQNAVTQTEVLGPMRPESVLVGTVGYGALYLLLTLSFFSMLFHAVRYGVVPVRRVGRHP